MNWKKYRKYLVPIGAPLVFLGLAILVAFNLPRCKGAPPTTLDAASSLLVGPTRPEQPVAERAGPGEISLEGGVYDASGAPVVGAEVTAHFELGPGVDALAPQALPPGTPPGIPPGTLHDAGTDIAQDRDGGPGLAIETMPVVVAVSGADGGFALRGLIPGRYRLRVAGQDIFTSEIRFFDVPAEGVRLIVARKVAVAGQVLDPEGRPVVGARVGLESDTQGQVFTDSDESGRFSFTEQQEGVFKVWAGHGAFAARARRVPRLGAGPFPDVILTLEPGTSVVGRVVDRVTDKGLAAFVRLTATDSEEPVRYTESAPDGVFRIQGLPTGRYSAEAVAPGYVATEAIEFQASPTFSPVIALTPGARLAGRVVDHRGVPVEGAVLSVRGVDENGLWQVISEDTESQRIERARGRIGDLADAQGRGGPEGARFIPRGELGVLLGPIPYPPPKGAAALRIARALDQGGANPDESETLPVHPDLEARFISDRQGRFRITGLAPGTYRLIATHAAYADAIGDRISLGLGQAHDDLELVMRPGVLLTGHVTNTRGDLVVGAAIIAEPLSASVGKGDRSKKPEAAARPGASGDLALRALDPEHKDPDALIEESLRLQAVTAADGRYQLGPIAIDAHVRVTAVRHGDVERTIDLGPLSELGASVAERVEDFVLPVADAVLAARVRDSVNFPVRSAQVTIERMAGKKQPGKPETWSDKWPEKWVRTASTDGEGMFEIAGLAPGRYRVVIEHPGFPALATEVGTRTSATEAPTDITVPFGGGIEAEVRDAHTKAAMAGARVLARGPKGASLDTAASESGALELVPLSAGAWTLEVSSPGYVAHTVRVDVPRGSEPRAITVRDLRLELERGATIAGTVRDHHGVRVRGAQVSVGASEHQTETDEQGMFRMRDVPTGEVEIRAQKGAARGSISLTLSPGDELVTLAIDLAEPGSDPADEASDEEPGEGADDGGEPEAEPE